MLTMLIIAFATATTPTPVAGRYVLAATLRDGDRVVGTPRMEFAPDQAARIAIGDGANEQYDLSFVATPKSAGMISITWKIHARSALGDRKAAPTLLVKPGQQTSIASGGRGATARPFRLEFSVTPSPA